MKLKRSYKGNPLSTLLHYASLSQVLVKQLQLNKKLQTDMKMNGLKITITHIVAMQIVVHLHFQFNLSGNFR